jgi:hypothetical protein
MIRVEEIFYFVFDSVRIHLAHNTFRTFRPFSKTVTFCRLGRNVRFVARMEKERLCPKVVFLPQVSHFAMIFIVLSMKTTLSFNLQMQHGILP